MFFDLHNDFPTELDSGRFKDYINRAHGTVTAAIWTSEFGDYEALDRVKKLTYALAESDIPIAIEDLGFLERKDAQEKFDFSQYFYCSLTWNYDNIYAGGALSLGGLTSRGRAMINIINASCALDTAHLNRASFYPAVDAAKHPMCSHTGFADCDRCLNDEQIKALVARHGIIGLCAVTRFTGAFDTAGLARQIDMFTQKYGSDVLCLGSDFFGSKDLPDDFRDYDGIDRLKAELGKLGYTDDDVDNFLYKNALRFYEVIQDERHL